MTSAHKILPVFLPKLGCPGDCVFCNQSAVTNVTTVTSPQMILSLLPNSPLDELAFYGGSFLSLPDDLLQEYLQVFRTIKSQGRCKTLRISTRPDSVSIEKLHLLDDIGPCVVEVGVQSLSDKVLLAAGRNHNAECTLYATKLLRTNGHQVGWQLMLGLPEELEEDRRLTLAETIKAHPDFVRLSPTLVLEGTLLAISWKRDKYRPLELEETLDILADWIHQLTESDINIARVGLHPADGFITPGNVLAGPWHPALGEMAYSRVTLNSMLMLLVNYVGDSPLILVPERRISSYLGQHKTNLEALRKKWPGIRINAAKVESPILKE